MDMYSLFLRLTIFSAQKICLIILIVRFIVMSCETSSFKISISYSILPYQQIIIYFLNVTKGGANM